MQYNFEYIVVEFIETSKNLNLQSLKDFGALCAIAATAISARMAAVAKPPRPQQCL